MDVLTAFRMFASSFNYTEKNEESLVNNKFENIYYKRIGEYFRYE